MAENSQLSDETKNNSTDTSSTDVSSAVIGNHENAIVPHKISNHDKLVQTMVMVDGEWINVNDTNDQANVKYDMHKVNKKVVEAQKGIVEAKNAADSAVKYADSAVSASKVNSDAIVAQSSAISEAKAATDSATAEVQQLKANAASDAASIRADVAAASETLMGQGKQIATINTTLDGLNTKYEGFSDNLSKLSGTVAINSTQIDQNKKSIALKADQATVDNLSGEVSRNTAQLKVQADQISSKVSSEDFNTLDNKASGAIAQINKNTTAIDQTNKQISLKADQTEVDNVKNMAQQNSSRLDVMDNKIQSKVTSTDVNNIINEKGFTTQSTVQSLIEQKAGTLNESITKLSNDTVTHFQSITASLDGLQTNVTNYQNDTTSKYTQLSNLMQSKVGTADFEQLKRSVDMQILDYADINNMKTNGHYFVHNLANNPIGGWVYVDVTGNANDRIRQDVYQDSGTKHAFRRWFGSYWTEWSTGAEESEITQLRNDINLRVKSGDLLSQINIAAGHTLIQSNKIYFDADSFVMSPNSTAFIPSAYITNINADKITTGTLDAAKFNVKNLSADSITSGTLDGIKFKTEFTNDNGISIMGDRIAWTSMTSFGEQLNGWIENSTQEIDWLSFRDLRLQSANNIAIDTKGTDDVTRWSIADYDYYDQPGLMSSTNHKFIPEEHRHDESADADQSNAVLLASANTYVAVRRRTGIVAHLDSKFFNEDSTFSIQKEDKVGFYVGQGENGNQVNVQLVGDGSGFNVHGNFNVYGAKNSAVKTSQGDVAVSAYETAEYYFGDIGEGQTDSNGVAYAGIEKLFNETVNTSIPYQVFITAYGPGNVWVEQREHDRFVVKSDRPNVKFGWEIKAKRRGYENTRLQKVN